jgi:homoserine dehydrogenase
MSVGVVEGRTQSWPIRVRAGKPSPRASVRTIRIGLLGLGQVGQAVARLAADRAATAPAGIRFRIEQALVADVTKPRRCPRPARLTSHASAFLRGQYDVVIEALGQVEPARTLVARLLGRGTSVVTANKALVAEHGPHLEAIAAARGCGFRYEATALSAIPFLGTLADRPLVSSVDRVLAIVNGTSNFLLTALTEPATTFDQAVARAQAQGYAEPDPSRDLDGFDAADKLVLLASLFGWGRLSREALEVRGIRQVTAADLGAAQSLGGTIKAVVGAERSASGIRAFVGPAFLSSSEPLAALGGALNGIRLDGRHVSNLFFSGPGAGPDVTAATLLDDAAYVSSVSTLHARPVATVQPVSPVAPITPWLLRLTFPGMVPPAEAVRALVSAAGIDVECVAEFSTDRSRWLLVAPRGRRDVDAAIQKLSTTHRIDAVAFRRV